MCEIVIGFILHYFELEYNANNRMGIIVQSIRICGEKNIAITNIPTIKPSKISLKQFKF
jgi:hypothetical protein